MATNKNYVEEHWRVCVTKKPPTSRSSFSSRPSKQHRRWHDDRVWAPNTSPARGRIPLCDEHAALWKCIPRRPPSNQPTNRGWRTLSITRVFHAARCLEAAKLRRYCAAVSDHIFHARRNRKEMKRRERERIREYITRYTIAWSRVDVDLYT